MSLAMRRVVIGVGNPDRRDDGAGRAVAQRLLAAGLPGLEVVELDGEATALIDAFSGGGEVWVVDALASGARPGTVRSLDATAAPLPSEMVAASSHGLGVAAAIELARALGRLPRRLVVLGIEGTDFGPGNGLTPPVAAAVARLARRLSAVLRSA